MIGLGFGSASFFWHWIRFGSQFGSKDCDVFIGFNADSNLISVVNADDCNLDVVDALPPEDDSFVFFSAENEHVNFLS